MMLRVETQQLDGALICRLEGRFTGEGAEEVRRLVTHCDSELEFVIDLTDVMFIDAIGEQVLLFVKRLGAQFVAETSYSRDVCERLELPLIGKHRSNLQEPVVRTETGIVLAVDDRAPCWSNAAEMSGKRSRESCLPHVLDPSKERFHVRSQP